MSNKGPDDLNNLPKVHTETFCSQANQGSWLLLSHSSTLSTWGLHVCCWMAKEAWKWHTCSCLTTNWCPRKEGKTRCEWALVVSPISCHIVVAQKKATIIICYDNSPLHFLEEFLRKPFFLWNSPTFQVPTMWQVLSNTGPHQRIL